MMFELNEILADGLPQTVFIYASGLFILGSTAVALWLVRTEPSKSRRHGTFAANAAS
jgi:hypothetical protein